MSKGITKDVQIYTTTSSFSITCPISEYIDSELVFNCPNFNLYELPYPSWSSSHSGDGYYRGEQARLGRYELCFDAKGTQVLLQGMLRTESELGYNYPFYNYPLDRTHFPTKAVAIHPDYKWTTSSTQGTHAAGADAFAPKAEGSSATLYYASLTGSEVQGSHIYDKPIVSSSSLTINKGLNGIEDSDRIANYSRSDAGWGVMDVPHITGLAFNNPNAFMRFRVLVVRVPSYDPLFFTQASTTEALKLDANKCVSWYMCTFLGDQRYQYRVKKSDCVKPMSEVTDKVYWFSPNASSRKMTKDSPYTGHFDIMDDTTIRLDSSNGFRYKYHKMFKLSDVVKHPNNLFTPAVSFMPIPDVRKYALFLLCVPPIDSQCDVDIGTKMCLYNHPRYKYPFIPDTGVPTGPLQIPLAHINLLGKMYYIDSASS